MTKNSEKPTLHIYAAKSQPATHWVHSSLKRKIHFRNPPNRLIYCHNCRKKRPAKNLVVQSYYDCVKYFCKEGKGCHGKS